MTRRRMLAAVALAAAACAPATCGHDTPAGPTMPSVTAGSISQSPATVGVLAGTTFTFAAEGFASSNGEPLSYAWDFGDRAQTTGGPVATHVYTLDWPAFNVSVTATGASGAMARAVRWGVQVRSLTGNWGLMDSEGRLMLGATALTQEGPGVSGADIRGDCRVFVSGRVSPPRSVSLAYTREGSGCDPRLPAAFVFSGTADEEAGSFLGAMTPGGPARLLMCDEAWECWW